MTSIATKVMRMEHVTDPKDDILDKVGDIKNFTVHGPRILVAVYERPEKTASGLFLPDRGTREEDRWQGRVCLVLKKGPLAFKDDDNNKFHGDDVEVGSWVVLRPTDGSSILINNQMCRLVNDQHVQMTVPDPDSSY